MRFGGVGGGGSKGGESINVTPLIDVVMVLIIFYLIVGKLAQDQRSQLELPRSEQGYEAREGDVLVVNVLRVEGEGAKSVIEVDGLAMDLAVLSEMIRVRLADDPVTVVEVRADRTLAYGRVRPVLGACKKAGAASIRLATEGMP